MLGTSNEIMDLRIKLFSALAFMLSSVSFVSSGTGLPVSSLATSKGYSAVASDTLPYAVI